MSYPPRGSRLDGYSRTEKLQKQHYDSIASAYGKHYGDTWSQAYRWRFINESLFGNIDLSGLKVLDAMCGSGETTEYLVQKESRVTGLDISGEAIHQFRERWPNCDAHCASIFSTGCESSSFDCVAIMGGLHHLHPDISVAINEVYRVLKPGGYFCFAEPHKGSIPDRIRQVWYRYDSLFVENEAAIDIEALEREFVSKFEFIRQEYKGNLAYLFVFSSMVLRIPLRMKSVYSPVLLKIESILERYQGKRLSCIAICQWRKR
jgi:ubiquinone/menaquinone biosynthesis C-methylase UbiE